MSGTIKKGYGFSKEMLNMIGINGPVEWILTCGAERMGCENTEQEGVLMKKKHFVANRIVYEKEHFNVNWHFLADAKAVF